MRVAKCWIRNCFSWADNLKEVISSLASPAVGWSAGQMTLIMFFEFIIGITNVYIAGKIGKEIQAKHGFVIQLYFI
jgi:hypothetical protein